MKSSFVMDSKYHSEGRHGLPRRRVTTKTHENGDNFELELSLAIKESLKYAKEKEGQLRRVDKTSPLLNGVKSDESFTQMAGKVLTFATSSEQRPGSAEEVQQLKDLLLIHIELIQRQQELLANKDREIRALRNEKETVSL
jgi:male-specific lethal 1